MRNLGGLNHITYCGREMVCSIMIHFHPPASKGEEHD